MNDQEIDKLLKSARVPEESPEFCEELAVHVSRTLRQRQRRGERFAAEQPSFAIRNWAIGAAGVTGIALIALLASWDFGSSQSDNGFARAEKCFREVESLFPNQLRALVFGADGQHLEVSEKADVPDSPPVYLKICGPKGCQEIVTFSGQQVLVNGDLCDVLLDSAGDILLVGQKLLWSSGSPERALRNYRIEARSMAVPS